MRATADAPMPLAAFHGRAPLPDGAPLAVVHGNCQAESLRLVLCGDDLTGVRIPPVHELTAADVPRLDRLLAAAAVLVTQPIRAGYHGLPIGTAEVISRLPPGARVVIAPVVRDHGLYPYQAIVRPAHDPGEVPPLVPYHDLRVLAHAAGRPLDGASPRALRAVARDSLDELRARERRHGAVPVSDLLRPADFGSMRTINHPGNPIWIGLAARVRTRLGLTDGARDPGRPLLDSIHAPREAAVIDALGLDATPDPDWRVGDRRVSPGELRDAHLEWYRRHPQVVDAGLSRHAATLARLTGS